MRRILLFPLALVVVASAAVVSAPARAADPVDVVCATVQALDCRTYYRDMDGDTYGDPKTAHRTPLEPSGEISRGDDCNDHDATVHPGAVETYDGRDEDCDGLVDEVVLVVAELMVNPKAVADTAGEWVEVANSSSEPVGLDGVSLVVGTRQCALGGRLAARGRIVVARSADTTTNGGLVPDFTCSITLTNSGARVGLVARSADIDAVDYTGFVVPDGASLNLDPRAHDATANDAAASWCAATSVYGAGDRGTPGASNDDCPTPPG